MNLMSLLNTTTIIFWEAGKGNRNYKKSFNLWRILRDVYIKHHRHATSMTIYRFSSQICKCPSRLPFGPRFRDKIFDNRHGLKLKSSRIWYHTWPQFWQNKCIASFKENKMYYFFFFNKILVCECQKIGEKTKEALNKINWR